MPEPASQKVAIICPACGTPSGLTLPTAELPVLEQLDADLCCGACGLTYPVWDGGQASLVGGGGQ